MRKGISLVLLVAFLVTIFADEPEDPCHTKFCRHGKTCVVNEDKSTVCECPTDCPKESDPVCSVYGMEFSSPCEMHKFACRNGIIVRVGHKGKCVRDPKAVKPCPVEQLLQFHGRYMAFIMLAKESKINPDFKMDDQSMDALTDVEKTDIVMWEFESRDLDKNDILDPREIETILNDLLLVENCVYGFLKSCDYNNDGSIERGEWQSCFPPVLADIEDVTDP